MLRYLALLAILGVAYSFGSNYVLSLMIIIALHGLVAIGLSLLMGYMGQISLGHAAFYGLGAYGSALLAIHLGLTPWLTIPLAAGLVGLIGWSLGWLIFRLHGHHLAMATLGFGIVVHVALIEFSDITGGPNGLTGIPALSLLGRDLFLDAEIVPIAWAACVLALIVSENLVRSPLGLAMHAIGANQNVAASMGLDPGAAKRWILAVSAVFAAVGGGLFGHYVGYLAPDPFGVVFSVKLLLMVAVGGFANVWGVLFGVAFITLIGELFRPIGHYDVIVFGALLVTVIIFFPQGLFAGLGKSATGLRSRLAWRAQ